MSTLRNEIKNEFTSVIEQCDFPCVGAKTALHKDQITLNVYGDINCDLNVIDILGDMYSFLDDYDIKTKMYSSFVCIFDQNEIISEEEFDAALWRKLQQLHNVDKCAFNWDSTVSKKPLDPNFGFSLGGYAFFVIGFNPQSSRKSRRFRFPAIVFNPHNQFDQLREAGKFEKFRDHIRQRDVKYSGSKNPMLADFGDRSEVYQYSGRKVSNSWKCPFAVNG
ncbi:guanitoxin biosynthesis heme-dependent pre-guanitoxin N-hydroxylase GntA [Alteromonas oceanisediminis]|uniref:guanitoxin biosynthesis heme-dependent pre-guanitoxin N-hydroxylase GntA n=1 Tax=Alteromonas oceanisediminis TaxID=2836180 RepID=UPI001BD919DB|nr:guanitoxin biosynthesis heme-dependent pre-guanitoxin N-hydroxylase GntA [Alteromonas oceanisediminis]MBT0587076.1 YqcI/YcgG family protein [Alteromonas oceanisediminis]